MSATTSNQTTKKNRKRKANKNELLYTKLKKNVAKKSKKIENKKNDEKKVIENCVAANEEQTTQNISLLQTILNSPHFTPKRMTETTNTTTITATMVINQQSSNIDLMSSDSNDNRASDDHDTTDESNNSLPTQPLSEETLKIDVFTPPLKLETSAMRMPSIISCKTVSPHRLPYSAKGATDEAKYLPSSSLLQFGKIYFYILFKK